MAGQVYVDGQKEDKAGSMFADTVKVEVRGNTLPYVSRGGKCKHDDIDSETLKELRKLED